LFFFRLLCSGLVSFVSSGLKCLKVSESVSEWPEMALSVFFCLYLSHFSAENDHAKNMERASAVVRGLIPKKGGL